MAVSEEKASSDIETSFIKEKVEKTTSTEDVEDGIKTDAMLDEIAAKVDALDFNKTEEEEDDEDNFHSKCVETVKKQGETINTLVQQLRIMFDEYQSIDQEREYYEELNDALIRCLELTEGRIEFESDDSEKEEENITNLISKEPKDSSVEMKTLEKENNNDVKETEELKVESKKADTKEEANEDEEETNESEESNETKRFAKSELIRLNRILLREIFELRHQIDVMKENIREYLYSDEESEDDTATDEDEHVCEHCSGGELEKRRRKKEDDDDDDDDDDGDDEEEYEHLEDEDLSKINDEPDTE